MMGGTGTVTISFIGMAKHEDAGFCPTCREPIRGRKAEVLLGMDDNGPAVMIVCADCGERQQRIARRLARSRRHAFGWLSISSWAAGATIMWSSWLIPVPAAASALIVVGVFCLLWPVARMVLRGPE